LIGLVGYKGYGVNGMVGEWAGEWDGVFLVGDLGVGGWFLKGGIRMEEDGSLVVFGAGVTD